MVPAQRLRPSIMLPAGASELRTGPRRPPRFFKPGFVAAGGREPTEDAGIVGSFQTPQTLRLLPSRIPGEPIPACQPGAFPEQVRRASASKIIPPNHGSFIPHQWL